MHELLPTAVRPEVDAPILLDALTGNGPYEATIRLRSQMVPVNLVIAIQDVGFDFGMSAREVADALIEGLPSPAMSAIPECLAG